jgi:ABC-2 type transport system ATP-binding protein
MLHVDRLSKDYGNLKAVDEVSFRLAPGDIFGFIGSNGAGKTTTIKMISTLLEPTSGTATINGHDILKDPMEVRKHIGYMPDFFGLYDDIKVWEYLDFFANIYQVPPRKRREVIDNVLELTDLTTKRESFVQTLSRGMQQRLCLARCLVHDPSLLLLDEPASGLDPRARAELKELLIELGRMGKIIIVSSHILPELADFCNSVGIIERGVMLTCGPVQDVIRSGQMARQIEVRVLSNVESAAKFICKHEGIADAEPIGTDTIMVSFNGDLDAQARLLQDLISHGHRVVDFRELHADLEDVFLRITTGAVN